MSSANSRTFGASGRASSAWVAGVVCPVYARHLIELKAPGDSMRKPGTVSSQPFDNHVRLCGNSVGKQCNTHQKSESCAVP
jgi:hypothetical protein